MLAQQLTQARASIQWTFSEWMAQHGKSYQTLAEYEYRLAQFLRSEEEIITHRFNTPNMTYSVSHNAFSDWSREEKDKRASGRMTAEEILEAEYAGETVQDSSLMNLAKSSINWCNQGACNPIRNQGHCGSCWAFAATAVMESRDFIKHGSLVKGSEQHCVDCSTEAAGCDYGYQSSCYSQSIADRGLDSRSSYPYTGYDGKCVAKGGRKRVWATDYHHPTKKSESSMINALQSGPITAYVNSSGHAFDYYDGDNEGVINDTRCGTSGNHFVAIVGYGTTSSGNKYWKVRNSWGTSWGQKGYGKLKRTGESSYGICGIQQYTEYPDMG